MSTTDAPTIDLPLRRRRVRRRTFVGAGVAVVIAAAALAVTNPFAGSGAGSGSLDNGSATSIATVARRALSSQTQVNATLGYAQSSTIAVPAGTPPASVLQAQQTAATDRTQLQSAQATYAEDRMALEQARSTLAADRRRAAVACRGADAAGSGCTSAAQTLVTDEQNVATDSAKVAGDERSVSAAQTALAGAATALAAAQSSATAYAQTSVYTRLPAVGAVIRPGQSLYEVDGKEVVLLKGGVTAWRAFVPGMSPGRDVAELNANLGVRGDAFTAQTAAAIRSFQAAHGLARTGELLLGSIVFEPGPVRVTSVTPTRGATVQTGAVLAVTSTRREVTIALDADQQANVKVGDPVTITLPNGDTTPGKVSYVGTVATTPSSDSSSSSSQTPTIEVDVAPTDPRATGRLDQAPVTVSITTATVDDALVVPVNALLALASGGYAIEEVGADGTHKLVAVELGLFDDSDGLVQVTGSGVAPGQRIVVPAQ